MEPRTVRIVLAASLIVCALLVAGYFSHAYVTVQFGCEQVKGHELCGKNLKAYKDFRDTVKSFGE